jgi:hypothetical protein
MKFAFDVDEVLRATLDKTKAVYEKFFIEDYIYEEGEEKFNYEIIEPITSDYFFNFFKFPTEDDYVNFMYIDFPMSINGHAPAVSANTFNIFSDIQKNVLKKKDTVSVISKGVAKQKPATLFFLSKYGLETDEILFYNTTTYKKMWSKFDVIVTASPNLLLSKPEKKISIKVQTCYNENINSDFTIKSIEDFTSIYKLL